MNSSFPSFKKKGKKRPDCYGGHLPQTEVKSAVDRYLSPRSGRTTTTNPSLSSEDFISATCMAAPLDMPQKGDENWEYEWKGAKWRFSSQENLERFKANPEKYAPRFGGY